MKNKTPQLLLLTHYYPAHQGGIEIVAGQLASRLANDYSILWLASDCDPAPVISGIKCAPQPTWNKLEAKGLPWPIWTLQGFRHLKQAIAKSDIIHVHDFIYPAHLIAIFFAQRQGKPVVVTQHIGDIEYRSALLRGILKIINRSFGRWLLGMSSQVVFISPRVKAGFEAYTQFSRPPLYWPNGMDKKIYHPVEHTERISYRQTHGLAPDKPVLLFVGRFVERKGLDLLRQMATARPDWQWCFAGWGPLDPAMWGLKNVHVWSGLQGPQLAPLYQLADLLILPSYGEGFPLVVQESLACGTPVIVSEETAAGGPAMPDSIISLPHCPTSPNLRTWLDAVESYLNDNGIENRRYKAAEQAALLWDWERLANKYHKLFGQLFSKTQTRSLYEG